MPGVRRLEGGVQGFRVPDLADQDHVGILAQHVPERGSEGERVAADLPLRDVGLHVAMEELDRILDRDHVARGG